MMVTTESVLLYFVVTCSGLVSSSHWSYRHEEEWPTNCKNGKLQSPIALSHSVAEPENFSSLIFEQFDATYPVQLKNNGHSIEIRLHVESQPTVKGGGLPFIFVLDHLHFHWESEHVMDNRRFPLELHLVHYATQYANVSQALNYPGGVAVLSVLFHLSPDDDMFFEPLVGIVERLQDKFNTIEQMNLNLHDFLPRDRAGFYRYNGSLTTPECTEGIIWTVFTDTLPVSRDQVKYFTMVRADQNETLRVNYRPLQKLNGRKIQIRASPIYNLGHSLHLLDRESVLTVILLVFAILNLF